jgi:NADH-quinone oxidoreductase subunit N
MTFDIPIIDWATIAAPLVLVAWGSALMLIGLFVANNRTIAYVALLGVAVSALINVPFWGEPPRLAFAGMALLDQIAILVDWALLLTAAITILFSMDYLRRQRIEMNEYYTIVLFATAAMMTMAHSHNLIVLFLGLEWLSIALYVLAGFAYPRIRSQEAAMKYLLYGSLSAGFLIYGIAVIYGVTGTTDLQGIADQLGANAALLTSPGLLIGLGLVLIGLGYKITMVPFHMWAPDVYEGSPTPITAYMSTATKVAGFVALLRVLQIAFIDLLPQWQMALAVIAALTMIVGNVAAVVQNNLKRMLSYSSIAQAGFIMCALVGLNQDGAIQSLLYYLLAYTITNMAAFAVVIAIEQFGEERFDIADLAGIGWREPVLGATMAIFMLSLAGIPPLVGFFAKLLVFLVAYQAGFWWLVLIGLLTSVVSAFYYLRIIVNMYMRERPEPTRSFASWPLLAGVTVAAILLIGQLLIISPFLEIGQTLVAGR